MACVGTHCIDSNLCPCLNWDPLVPAELDTLLSSHARWHCNTVRTINSIIQPHNVVNYMVLDITHPSGDAFRSVLCATTRLLATPALSMNWISILGPAV